LEDLVPDRDQILIEYQCVEWILRQDIIDALATGKIPPELPCGTSQLARMILQSRKNTISLSTLSTLTTQHNELSNDIKNLNLQSDTIMQLVTEILDRMDTSNPDGKKRKLTNVKELDDKKVANEPSQQHPFSHVLYYDGFGYIRPLSFQEFHQLEEDDKFLCIREVLMAVLHRQFHIVPNSRVCVLYIANKNDFKNMDALASTIDRATKYMEHRLVTPLLFVVGDHKEKSWDYFLACQVGTYTNVYYFGDLDEDTKKTFGCVIWYHFRGMPCPSQLEDSVIKNLLDFVHFDKPQPKVHKLMEDIHKFFGIALDAPSQEFIEKMKSVVDSPTTHSVIHLALSILIILTLSSQLNENQKKSLEYFLNLNKIIEEEQTYGMTLVYASFLREAATNCLKVMEGSAASAQRQAQETTSIGGPSGRNYHYNARLTAFLATYQANVELFFQKMKGVDMKQSAKYFCNKKTTVSLDIPVPPTDDDVVLHDILLCEKESKSSKPEAGNKDSPVPKKKQKEFHRRNLTDCLCSQITILIMRLTALSVTLIGLWMNMYKREMF
jgi:hypothetical protein